MGLFERRIFILPEDGKKHRFSVRLRPQNRYVPQNDPQIAKEELGPFLTIFGTRMRAIIDCLKDIEWDIMQGKIDAVMTKLEEAQKLTQEWGEKKI